MQEVFKLNNIEICQPDEDISVTYDTTFSDDSTRSQNGKSHYTPMFTVESLDYKASHISVEEAKEILQIIVPGKTITAHYFSPYHGEWRNAVFFVESKDIEIGTLEEGQESLSSLSFTMTGVEKI